MIAKKYTWTQPNNQKPLKSEPKNTESKIGAPAPRANHTATFIEDQNKVFIVGGHGGVGYSRKAFNDIHTYDVETQEWTLVQPAGSGPRERGGHSASLLPKSQKIFIYGGWNSTTQFENFFIYDAEKNEWTDLDASSHDVPRWSHASIMVPALPNHLLFVFGGSSDFFEEGTPRTFANLSNTAQFISIAGDLKQSKWRVVDPEEPEDNPLPRENTSMVYDESNNRLLVFGGWSNKYMNDVHELNISSITGPQYAIYDIEPKLGPYTGNTNCVITGEGFVPNRTYVVEFNAGKYPLTTQARYMSPTQIECVTPEFVAVGPKEASVRVRAERGDLTLTDVPFQFFLNTQSDKTIAFGPGLLEENKVGVDTVFFIQTRNMKNENRTSGRDNFEIEVYTEREEVETNEEGEETVTVVKDPIEYKIDDLDNGQYQVVYQSEKPAEVFLDIKYSSEVQKPAQIRGGPFKATFTEDAPEENNTFTGPSM